MWVSQGLDQSLEHRACSKSRGDFPPSQLGEVFQALHVRRIWVCVGHAAPRRDLETEAMCTTGALVAGGDDGDGYGVMDGGTWSRSSEEAAGVRGRSFEKGIH